MRRNLITGVGLSLSLLLVVYAVRAAPERLPGERVDEWVNIATEPAGEDERDERWVVIGPDWVLAVDDVMRRLDALVSPARLRFQVPAQRRAAIEAMATMEVIASRARREGLHRSPEVQLHADDAVALAWARQQAALPPIPSEDELRRFYEEEDPFSYRLPHRRQVHALTVDDEEEAQRIAEELRWLRQVGSKTLPVIFAEFVEAHSVVEEERVRGGDWGAVAVVDERFEPEVLRLIFTVRVARDLQVVQRADGRWSVLWIPVALDEQTPAFEEVRDRMVFDWSARQRAEAMRRVFDEAREREGVVVDAAVLARLADARRAPPTEERPRRYSAAAFMEAPEAVIGHERAARYARERSAWAFGPLPTLEAAPDEAQEDENDDEADDGAAPAFGVRVEDEEDAGEP